MTTSYRLCVYAIMLTAVAITFGCEKASTSTPADSAVLSQGPPDVEAAKIARAPASGASASGVDAAGTGEKLRLTGLTMTVPQGWVPLPVQEGPMAAKSVFALPRADGDEEDGMVRITHFPGMKGMDKANIDRWLAQVGQADGTPSTRDDADIKVIEAGHVRLTLVDVSGTVKATMRAAPKPNSRMIAAIVDHPQGPHFVVATGSIGTIQKWEGAIRAFLNSATAD